jgi:AcrR family transcriptional regulator
MTRRRAPVDVRREQMLQAAFEVASREGIGGLHALLQQEMARLSDQPRHTRLFFEFWALGARHEEIRARIGAELKRYRAAFRAIMEELLEAEPGPLARVTADGMAAVAVSWIHGCAVQAMVDPAGFDSDDYFAAVRGVIGRLA